MIRCHLLVPSCLWLVRQGNRKVESNSSSEDRGSSCSEWVWGTKKPTEIIQCKGEHGASRPRARRASFASKPREPIGA